MAQHLITINNITTDCKNKIIIICYYHHYHCNQTDANNNIARTMARQCRCATFGRTKLGMRCTQLWVLTRLDGKGEARGVPQCSRGFSPSPRWWRGCTTERVGRVGPVVPQHVLSFTNGHRVPGVPRSGKKKKNVHGCVGRRACDRKEKQNTILQ